ncbi:MAG TPA: lasso peptide biosynthesis B2 protein [Solirubrobacteraceae bacterium]|nr:lasso peptide biosynthesis B2 protein [Solirubrobacteraceae bacterium]
MTAVGRPVVRPRAGLRRLTVDRHIPAGGMPQGLKLALAAEIFAGYITARRLMLRHDIRDVVLVMRPPGAPPAANGREPEEAMLVARRLGYAVTRTLRKLPTDSRCLVQALVLSRLLSVRGIDSTLVIGARSGPEFAAHAWVEYAGEPVLSPAGFDESRLVEL